MGSVSAAGSKKSRSGKGRWCICEWCSKAFRKNGGKCSGRLCTRTCSGQFKRNKRAIKEFWKWSRPCEKCGVCMGDLTDATKCRQCRQAEQKCNIGRWLFWQFMRPCKCGKPIWKYKQKDSIELCIECTKAQVYETKCKTCGAKAFVNGSKKKRVNCKDCRARSKRAGKGNHRERCKKYGLPYESVNMAFLYARDKGRCQICNCKCLKIFANILGTDYPHPRSPTIDHIIPLGHPENYTHGHTKENTQLCCFQCNTDKNDQRNVPIEELLALIG